MTDDLKSADALRTHARGALADRRFQEALACFGAATEAAPQNHAAWHDYGAALKLLGQPAVAETCLRRALELAPQSAITRHALGLVLLSQGRFAEGWPLADARHEIPQLRMPKANLPYPEWRGEDLSGKRLLVYPEQGFGDVIQYARLAPWLTSRGAAVTLFSHPALTRLFADSLGVQVIEATGQVEFPVPDYWVMSGGWVGRSGLTLDQIPNAPYLRAPAGSPTAGGGIGVVSRGRPEHANDANRSLAPAEAARLLALPGARSLQPEDTGARDFADTAALIAPLDLVISIDTAVAHLAAAMGKPTWIMLPAVGNDWRWMEGRNDTPWYPTARLFRQPGPGVGWDPVLAEVEAAAAAR